MHVEWKEANHVFLASFGYSFKCPSTSWRYLLTGAFRKISRQSLIHPKKSEAPWLDPAINMVALATKTYLADFPRFSSNIISRRYM